MQKIVTFFALVIAAAAMSACGIKPGNVKPPSEAQGKPFPSNYPKNARQ